MYSQLPLMQGMAALEGVYYIKIKEKRLVLSRNGLNSGVLPHWTGSHKEGVDCICFLKGLTCDGL